MAYRFNNGTDRMRFAVAPLSGYVVGAITIAQLLKIRAVSGAHQDYVGVIPPAGGSRFFTGLRFDSKPRFDNRIVNVFAPTLTMADISKWYILALTYPGGDVPGRFHLWNGTSWTHENSGGNLSSFWTSTLDPTDEIRIGQLLDAGYSTDSDVVCVGIDKADHTDAQIETLSPTSYAAWKAFGFDWLVGFEAAGAITDDGAVGTGDEIGRVGTTLVADPPGFLWPGPKKFYLGTETPGTSSPSYQGNYGVRFQAKEPGVTVTGVQFYRLSGAATSVTAKLWSDAGVELATVTGTVGIGWRELTFPTPVTLTDEAQYVVTVYTPLGAPVVTAPAQFPKQAGTSPVLALTVAAISGPSRYSLSSAVTSFPNQVSSDDFYVGPIVEAAAADTIAPSAPSGLTATPISATQIDLAWTASTDAVGVTGYKVERKTGAGSFSEVGTPSGTAFADTTLVGSTAYTYRVRATDAAGNLSGYSAEVTATTSAPPDVTPPTAPSDLAATPDYSTAVDLEWTPATDAVGVTGYNVERKTGAGAFAEIATPSSPSYHDTGLEPVTTYTYRVRARDAAGNVSGYSGEATAETTWYADPALADWVPIYGPHP